MQYNGEERKVISHIPGGPRILEEEKISPFEYQIFVKLPTGCTATLDVTNMTSIYDIKMMLQKAHNVSPNGLRIMFVGRQFDKDDDLLYQVGIPSEATLHCIYRMGSRGRFSITVVKDKVSRIVEGITRYTTGIELLHDLALSLEEKLNLYHCGKIVPLEDH